MDDFTKAERARIDYLYGNDFSGDITQEDIKLISRFEYARAYEDIQSDMKREQTANDSKRDIEIAQSLLEQALSNMQEQQARAIARLDALEKRERPTIEDAQKNEFNVVQRSAVTHDGK